MRKMVLVGLMLAAVCFMPSQAKAGDFFAGVKSFVQEAGDFDWKGSVGGDFVYVKDQAYAGAGATVYSSPWLGVRAGMFGTNGEKSWAYAGLTFNAGKAVLIGIEKLSKGGTVNPVIANCLSRNILMPGILGACNLNDGEFETGVIVSVIQFSIDF